MPERYTLTKSAEELGISLSMEIPEEYMPRYNAAPAQLLPLITSAAPNGLSFFYWGTIPGWSGNKSISKRIINIDVDSLLSKPAYIKQLRSFRAIVPSDGYYEWKSVGKKTKIPYRIEISGGEAVFFPAVWEEFEDENDQIHHVFKIITRESASEISDLSESMPVIFTIEEGKKWLNSETNDDVLQELLRNPSKQEINKFTVSSRIDRLDIDGPDLIKSVESMNQFGNYSLFD